MQETLKSDLNESLFYLLNFFEPLKNKTVTITGLGFMGSWLVRALTWLNDNHEFKIKIYVITKHIEKANIIVDKRNYIKIISADIRSINYLPEDTNFIIHTVGNPDNRAHMTDTINTIDTIVSGTKILLDNATRLENIEAIVHISSGQVYYKKESSLLNNENNFYQNLIFNVNNIYPEAKRYSETLCFAYKSTNKLPIIIVRPFSFIGPFQDLNKPWAVNSLLNEALNNQPMRIIGNGKPKRSYLYASDMAAWILVILANGKKGEVYNLGSSQGVSLLEITNKINTLIDKNVKVIVNYYNNDESEFIPDVVKLKERFGLKEVFNFERALERTISWNIKKLSNKDKNEN